MFHDVGVELRAYITKLFYKFISRRQQVQPPYAPIGRVGAALHQPAIDQPVDHAADRNPLDFEHVRKFGLCRRIAPRQEEQRTPLLAGHTETARPQVEGVTHLTRGIVQQKSDCNLGISKHAYKIIRWSDFASAKGGNPSFPQ